MKEIKDNGDEKKLLGIHPFSVYRTLYKKPKLFSHSDWFLPMIY